MDNRDEKLCIELMEAILDYFEGNRSFRSVVEVGISASERGTVPKNPNVAEVILQLNTLGNMAAVGQTVSRENIKETFTNMLEKLIHEKNSS